MPSEAVYRGPDRGVNLGCRVFLHTGKDAAIEAQGDADARMAEALLRHLRMNASGEKLRRMRMPQIAKPDVREGARPGSSRTNSWVRLFG